MSDDRTLTKTGEVAWAWATEHGAPERASTDQLVSWLARGELPAHTLVWKPGWGEWLPAMQVAELAAAFPSVTQGSRRVARLETQYLEAPPAVPVAHYPRLRLLAKDVVGHLTPAPFTSVAPARAERRALRDLDHAQQDVVTSQVPAAAMLEKARAMKEARAGLQPASDSERTSRPHFGTFGETLDPAPSAHDARGSAGLGAAPVASGSIQPRTLSPLAVELGFPALLDAEAYTNPLRRSRRYGLWLSLGVLAGGALGLLAIRGPSPHVAAPASNADSAMMALEPSRARVVTGPCKASRAPVRIDEHAIRDVPLALVSLSSSAKVAEASAGVTVAAGWVAVGYAQSHEAAAGVALAPDSLELQRLPARRAVRSVFSVSPIVRGGELELQSERDGASVAFARSVNADPPLRIGMNAQGMVAGPLDGPATRIWELPAGSLISVPSIALHPGGLTVATVLGRKQGPLRVGVLSAGGEPLSELGQIGGSGARFGRPALASGEGTTALAAAERSRDGSRQSIWLARAAVGAPPLALQPFEPTIDEPIGGGAAELDTLGLAALPGGGFALLFSRGHGWKRRVQLQRLSALLAPIGAPIDITTPDPAYRGTSAAGLYWVNDRLLAFHFLLRGGGASLWVSSIECQLG
jgi:hypothetical protein